MAHYRHYILASALTASLALAACSQDGGLQATTGSETAGTSSQSGAPAQEAQFTDIPIPTGSKLDGDRTLVFGGGEEWIGRLVLDSSHGANSLFDLYRREMPNFGWQEITTLRAKVSIMTYARNNRIATIQIQDSTLTGAEVVITISPKGTPVSAPAARGS